MSRQTRRLFSFSKHEDVILGYLLRPSWFSGLVSILVSTGVVLGAVLTFVHYNGSTLSGNLRQLLDLHGQVVTPSVNSTYQTLGNNFSSNVLISDIPLFIFWAGVGLVVYSFTTNIFGALRNVAELGAQLGYVNANRRELVTAALEHLLIRATVLVAWLLFMRYTAHVLLPYVIAVAHAGLGNIPTITAAGYMLWGIFLLAVCLHLHTILLRLLLLKPRVFWQSAYD